MTDCIDGLEMERVFTGFSVRDAGLGRADCEISGARFKEFGGRGGVAWSWRKEVNGQVRGTVELLGECEVETGMEGVWSP